MESPKMLAARKELIFCHDFVSAEYEETTEGQGEEGTL
jgi:hypothetical protein